MKTLFQSAAAPRLIVDPADSELTASVASPGGTFSDPLRCPDVPTARFVPRDPADLDAYDALFRWCFEFFPRYVWIDEAAQVAPVSNCPRWLNTYVVQGAKRMCGLVACHVRPREVAKNLVAQASHVFIFRLFNPDDMRYLADIVGCPLPQLEGAMNELQDKGFLWWNGPARELTIMPPLPRKAL